VCVLFERLVVTNEVVADIARVTEQVSLPPVVVRQQMVLRACGLWIQQILDHFSERDIMGAPKGLSAGVSASHRPHNIAPKAAFVIEGASRRRELVPVRRDETLKWMTDEHELEVCSQPLLDLKYVTLPYTVIPSRLVACVT